MSDTPDGELRYVAQRDPADRLLPAPEEPRRPVREVEPERRAQPHFHEKAWTQDRVGHPALLKVPFDGPFRRVERAVYVDVRRDRHIDELGDARLPRRVDELELAVSWSTPPIESSG